MKESGLSALDKSALCGAIRDNHVPSVIHYLGSKDNLEISIDSQGNTPLLLAIECGSHQTFRFLLGIGAKTDAINLKKLNAFDLASFREDKVMIQQLLIEESLNKLLMKRFVDYLCELKELKPGLDLAKKLYSFLIDNQRTLEDYYISTTGLHQRLDIFRTLRSFVMIVKTAPDENQFRKRLQNFFRRREEFIENTGIDYCFSPQSVINRICFEAAKFLVVKETKDDDEEKGPYDYLLDLRLTLGRGENQKWHDITLSSVLPENIAEIFCWQDQNDLVSLQTCGEIHSLEPMLRWATGKMEIGEINYDRIWLKTDPKSAHDKQKIPLPRPALTVLRQYGKNWRELIDYSLKADAIRKDPDSVLGRLNELCEGLGRGSKNPAKGGQGTELKAAPVAQDAVGAFLEWFNTRLNESEQKEMKNWSSSALTMNVDRIFILMQGSDSKEEELPIDFCVDLLGDRLRRILLDNETRITALEQSIQKRQALEEQTGIKKLHFKSKEELEKLQQGALEEIKSGPTSGIIINTRDRFSNVFDFKEITTEPFVYELSLDFEEISRSNGLVDFFANDSLEINFLESVRQSECLELLAPRMRNQFIEAISDGKIFIVRHILNFYPEFLHESIPLYNHLSGLEVMTTPLILAFFGSNDRAEMISHLLKKGADMFAVDSQQMTVREIAMIKGDWVIWNILTDFSKFSLKTALKTNNEKTITKILKFNSDLVYLPFFNDETILTWILKEDLSNDVLKLFLYHNPDILQLNSLGEAPLEMARKSGRLDKLRDLSLRKFLEALKSGDYGTIEGIVKYYPEFINEPFIENGQSVTPLTYAIFCSDEFKFQSVMQERKIELDERYYADKDVVKLFNSRLRNNKKISHLLQIVAFMDALGNQNNLMLVNILEKNPNFVNSVCLNGETALTFLFREAINKNRVPSIQTLELFLERRASIFQKNSQGESPLKMVFGKSWLNFLPNFKKRLIHDFYEAIKNGRIELVKEVLKYYPDFINRKIDLADDRFTTPLILAFAEDELDIADLLLRRGAFFLAINSENSNAIQSAIGKKAVQLLYEPCIKMLEKALVTGDIDTVKKIFELDCDLTHANLDGGETLLTFALKAPEANPDVIQYLLEQKFDIFLPNFLDETPIKIAQEKGQLAWIASKAHAVYTIAVWQNDLKKIEEILNYYPDFSNQPLTVDYCTDTPLMIAAFNDHPAMVRLFLETKDIHLDEKTILASSPAKRGIAFTLLLKAALEKVFHSQGSGAFYDLVLSRFPEFLNESLAFLGNETPVTHAIKRQSGKILDLVSHERTDVFSKNLVGESVFNLVRVYHIQFLEKRIIKLIEALEKEKLPHHGALLRTKLFGSSTLTPDHAKKIEADLKSFRSIFRFFKNNRIEQLEYALSEYRKEQWFLF